MALPMRPLLSDDERAMFTSGNVTIYVSNMDNAVRFYSETLGLKLAYRFGDNWASADLGSASTADLSDAIAAS